MRNIYFVLIFLIIGSCGSKKNQEGSIDVTAYNSEIEAWQNKRVDDLKGPKGWLNLAGLFWLKDGINTFGSGEKNDIVFPVGKIPARAGFFLLKGDVVTQEAYPNVTLMSMGKPVKEMVAFHPDSAKAPIIDYGSLQWFIIKRDNKFGVRLRDFKNQALETFHGIEHYPVDIAWRLEASFEKAGGSRTIDITNILGQTSPQPSPGTVVFSIHGKEYRLDAIDDDEGSDEYFMIFGDLTNAKETYGAGRYLYIEKPEGARQIYCHV